jgi:hypothetical protein
MFLDYADLDGDGLRDVIVPTSNRKLIFYKRQDKAGKTWQRIDLPFPDKVATGKAVRVADINLDGKPDLVVSFEGATGDRSGIVWMSYRKAVTDTWDVHELSGSPGSKFDMVQLFDLDNDGDLDVLSTDERAPGGGLGVVWYENPTR